MTELEKKMSNNSKIIYEGIPYFHPGLLLKEILDARGIEQKDFAQRTGFTEKHISYVLTGKSDITPAFAEKIAITLSESANTWLNLQARFDMVKKRNELAEELTQYVDVLKNFPIKDMVKNKLIAPAKDGWKLVRELMSFFAVGDISKLNQFSIDNHSIRYRKLNTGETKEAKAVLFRWGERIAISRETPPLYKKELLEEAVKNIRNNMCMNFPDVLTLVRTELHRAGVIFIFTPKISNAPASGYSYKYKENPVVLITYRNKQVDTFWFSLFHEIYHILNNDLDTEEDAKMEINANKYAKNIIIPLKDWVLFWAKNSRNITEDKIKMMSSTFNAPRSCIIGRLQADKAIKPYDFVYLKEKMDISIFDNIIFEEKEGC